MTAKQEKAARNPRIAASYKWTTLDHVYGRKPGVPHTGESLMMHGLCNNTKATAVERACLVIWLFAVNARLGL